MNAGQKLFWIGALLLAGVAAWLSRSHPEAGPESPANLPGNSSEKREMASAPRRDKKNSPWQIPPRAVASSPEPATRETNWLERLLIHGEGPEPLPPEEIQRWLELNRTNAASLLAARQANGGHEYLKQALQRYPNDPRVLFSATILGDSKEAHRERLDRFKEVAPDNALADYLSASDHLRNGRPDEAVQDLLAASNKTQFEDYVRDAIQNTEELYLSAGKSPAEAKALASSNAILPHLSKLKGLALEVAKLQSQYLADEEVVAAEALAQYGVQLSHDLTSGAGSGTLIGQLVGLATERIVIGTLDPSTHYDFLNGTVNDRLAQLDARKDSVKEDVQMVNNWFGTATEADIANYFERFKLFGEINALSWLRERLAGK